MKKQIHYSMPDQIPVLLLTLLACLGVLFAIKILPIWLSRLCEGLAVY